MSDVLIPRRETPFSSQQMTQDSFVEITWPRCFSGVLMSRFPRRFRSAVPATVPGSSSAQLQPEHARRAPPVLQYLQQLFIHPPSPRLRCVSPGLLKCLNATQMRLYFRPGPSSLHLGHGGAVLGQDRHQFVSPVKRVSEPAQLARHLLGGGDLWGRQITSDRSDHTRRSLQKTAQLGAGGADTHLFAPF